MIVYAPDADADVDRLHIRLLELSEGAANSFETLMARAERRIDARPRAYRLLNDGKTRRYSFRMNRTSYLIDFRVEPTQIVVLRVWHGRQARPS